MSNNADYVNFPSESERRTVSVSVVGARLMIQQAREDINVLYNAMLRPQPVLGYHFWERDVEDALRNIFDIDVHSDDRWTHRGRLRMLKERYDRLGAEITKPFRKVFVPGFAADGDAGVAHPSQSPLGAIQFAPTFLTQNPLDRSSLIVHELFHLRMQRHGSAHHPGMGKHIIGAGVVAHKPKKDVYGKDNFFQLAIANPWSYQWFCLACSPYYVPKAPTVQFGAESIKAAAH